MHDVEGVGRVGMMSRRGHTSSKVRARVLLDMSVEPARRFELSDDDRVLVTDFGLVSASGSDTDADSDT